MMQFELEMQVMRQKTEEKARLQMKKHKNGHSRSAKKQGSRTQKLR